MTTPHTHNQATPTNEAMLNTLTELLADQLADKLADRVADRLAERLNTAQEPQAPGDGLLPLDQLVGLLPATKKPQTWRRWLYERLRHGEVPGAYKLGGSWCFRAAEVRKWIQEGAP